MRRILLTGIPPLEVQDLAGPLEVFSQGEGYHVEIASPNPDGSVAINSGLRIAGGIFYKHVVGPVDTLWIVGGPEAPSGVYPPGYLDWLRSMYGQARRVSSSCLGTFILAAAGVLDGKRAVTHWQWCDKLAQTFPKISVDRTAIFVKDDKVYTSAGISTGTDLALTLVEEDFGRRRALAIAEWLVLYVRRTGMQTQLSKLLRAQATFTSRFDQLQEWILEHLPEDLSVETLARFSGMSPRHFARVFQQEKGVTPARFVEALRVEAAGRMLLDSRPRLKEVASQCGFGSADSMRRSFLRVAGVTPGDYAERLCTRRSGTGLPSAEATVLPVARPTRRRRPPERRRSRSTRAR